MLDQSDQRDQSDQAHRPAARDRRRVGACTECGQLRPLTAIYARHSADVTMHLCDTCRLDRRDRLDRFYQGD